MSDQLQFDDEEVSITLRRAWDRALRSLAAKVNKPTFETHIRAIKPLGMSDETIDHKTHTNVVLGVPSAFTREWVEKRHAGVIAGVLEEILDCDVRLKFALTPRDDASGATPSVSPRLSPSPALAAPASSAPLSALAPVAPAEGGADLFGAGLPLHAPAGGGLAVCEAAAETRTETTPAQSDLPVIGGRGATRRARKHAPQPDAGTPARGKTPTPCPPAGKPQAAAKTGTITAEAAARKPPQRPLHL